MTRCVAFLRAVNVGGRVVKMDALRAGFEALGLRNVTTFIASGNVIFDTEARHLATLEKKIEAHLHEVFGFEIHTFIRTQAELAAIVAREAFDAKAISAATTHVVGFMAAAPNAAAVKTIDAFNSEIDRLATHERELHWISHQKQSESTFSNAAFERALKVRATFRGMGTLKKLVAKLEAKRPDRR
jgi:uncharacterized protein (DUF1697 family)